MALTAVDLLQMASRNFILDDTTTDELVSFIEGQIADPFDSGDTNYLKRLSKVISGENEMDDQCQKFMVQLQDVYTHLTIDINDYDQHLLQLFTVLYNVLVRRVKSITYNFIREYIFNNKNRKTLIDLFSNIKVPNYPREQYGKKDYYVLMTKLPQIIDEIFDANLKLKYFIEFADRSEGSPAYLPKIKDYIDEGIIIDRGIVDDIYKKFKKCDDYRGMLNNLEIDITRSLIVPYLQKNGLMDVYIPPVEDIRTEDEEDDDE